MRKDDEEGPERGIPDKTADPYIGPGTGAADDFGCLRFHARVLALQTGIPRVMGMGK